MIWAFDNVGSFQISSQCSGETKHNTENNGITMESQ